MDIGVGGTIRIGSRSHLVREQRSKPGSDQPYESNSMRGEDSEGTISNFDGFTGSRSEGGEGLKRPTGWKKKDKAWWAPEA